jgi:tyrosyl-tRNA synthetase
LLFRTYNTYNELETDFAEGKLHPGDLKPAVAKVINELIEPVRKHFQNDPQAKALLKTIQGYNKEAAEKAKLQKE